MDIMALLPLDPILICFRRSGRFAQRTKKRLAKGRPPRPSNDSDMSKLYALSFLALSLLSDHHDLFFSGSLLFILALLARFCLWNVLGTLWLAFAFAFGLGLGLAQDLFSFFCGLGTWTVCGQLLFVRGFGGQRLRGLMRNWRDRRPAVTRIDEDLEDLEASGYED